MPVQLSKRFSRFDGSRDRGRKRHRASDGRGRGRAFVSPCWTVTAKLRKPPPSLFPRAAGAPGPIKLTYRAHPRSTGPSQRSQKTLARSVTSPTSPASTNQLRRTRQGYPAWTSVHSWRDRRNDCFSAQQSRRFCYRTCPDSRWRQVHAVSGRNYRIARNSDSSLPRADLSRFPRPGQRIGSVIHFSR